MTNLAVIDLDGVVADSTERFKRAEEARLQCMVTEGADLAPGVYTKKAVDVYWRTAFTPELVALDTLIGGADEVIEEIEKDYQVFYLTSRPESMREATRAWLVKHEIAGPRLVMKSSAFQYTKTTIWKAGMVQTLATLYGANIVKFVEDDEANWQELLKHTPYVNYSLQWCKSLKELIEYLEESKATEA